MTEHPAGGMRRRSKALLSLCLVAAIVTVALLTYLAVDRPSTPRGAQGPLTQETRERDAPRVPLPTKPKD